MFARVRAGLSGSWWLGQPANAYDPTRMKLFRAWYRYRNRRSALTLVEVSVALVLLAGLMVGMITAYGAHLRQMKLANERLAAIEVADQLLAQWYRGSEVRMPRVGQGMLPGAPSYVWQTRPINRSYVETLPVEIVRLKIFSAQAIAKNVPPLAQVDVLMEVKERPRLQR